MFPEKKEPKEKIKCFRCGEPINFYLKKFNFPQPKKEGKIFCFDCVLMKES
jgi:formylmethanofuran dehydrogenase subunit E